MKNKTGFTLLELLVVVLIIGILAGIALPQYRRAKEKSEASELLINVKALHEAQHRYFLTNGRYAVNFDDLDINFSGYTRGGCEYFDVFNYADCISNNKGGIFISSSKHSFALRKTGKYKRSGFVIMFTPYGSVPANKILCYAYKENDFCSKLFNCRLLQSDTVNAYYSCPF